MTITQETECFCNAWLCRADENFSAHEQFLGMQKQWHRTHMDAVAEIIKAFPYNLFLETKFWKTVAHEVRVKADFECGKCANVFRAPLHVHHKTYEHHGYEIQYWYDDLICLCEDCHSKEHGKPADYFWRVFLPNWINGATK